MKVQPFRFRADAARTAALPERLARSHRAAATADPQGRMGIPPADLARLARGLTEFDWPGFEARINRHAAYVVEDAQRLHFVHERSTDPGALPLLLLHGWPGSFLEFSTLIPELTAGTPAFHVVCPSLPGYGFSTRSLDEPCNTAAIAARMVHLMRGLGYDRFLVQGGDWGSMIGAQIARLHAPHCIGLHLNLAATQPPPEGDPARSAVLPEETAWLQANAHTFADGLGYYAQHNTRPQTLAVALADSPLGLLAWLGEKHLAWSDTDAAGRSLVSDQAILDHVALYWITDSIGSSIRLYYDEAHDPGSQSRVSVPTGVAIFPRELIRNPRAWVQYRFNLVHWSVLPRGGHFAALEVPDLLLADLRAFTRTLAVLP
ncbi:MAG: alpha/beta fold hydrolase [Proteobacteria bacterium]|nr:alpha/beta fold hydrolase [Pseudomonadota bacterium]